MGLTPVVVGATGVISLYQVGILKHLPQPPLADLEPIGLTPRQKQGQTAQS